MAKAKRSRVVVPVVGVVGTLVVAVGVAAVVRDRSSPERVPQRVAVPAYIDPTAGAADWSRLIATDSGAVGMVVANPASGPGGAADPAWRDVMARARASGKTVLGYVDTGYLGRTGLPTRAGATLPTEWRAQIGQDVDRWYELYPGLVDGIFLDQGDTSCGPDDAVAAAYRAIDRAVKQAHPGAMTVLNPGAAVPRCFEDTADVLLTFEDGLGAYDDAAFTGLDWTPADPAKLWHVIHGVPGDRVASVVATARRRGAGWVYVTDDVPDNPYDTLPPEPYWRAQVQAVAGDPPGAGGSGR
jgi:hypothetical protein